MEEKENIIKMIKSRIESENKKHKDLDWAEIAARKIFAEITYNFTLIKKESEN